MAVISSVFISFSSVLIALNFAFIGASFTNRYKNTTQKETVSLWVRNFTGGTGKECTCPSLFSEKRRLFSNCPGPVAMNYEGSEAAEF